MVCAFFGHSNSPDTVKKLIEQETEKLILENPDITFYVGTHGRFDLMAQSVLKKMAEKYPSIKYYIVFANYPTKTEEEYYSGLPTTLPDGFENAPPKFGISHRNRWIAKQADVVICYITHDWGGAAQFVRYAANQGKTIINLSEKSDIE